MITEKQAKDLKVLIDGYAYHIRNSDVEETESYKRWMLEYVKSITEETPKHLVVQVGQYFLTGKYSDGYLADIEQARKFASMAAAEAAINDIPHKENRLAAVILLLDEIKWEVK